MGRPAKPVRVCESETNRELQNGGPDGHAETR